MNVKNMFPGCAVLLALLLVSCDRGQSSTGTSDSTSARAEVKTDPAPKPAGAAASPGTSSNSTTPRTAEPTPESTQVKPPRPGDDPVAGSTPAGDTLPARDGSTSGSKPEEKTPSSSDLPLAGGERESDSTNADSTKSPDTGDKTDTKPPTQDANKPDKHTGDETAPPEKDNGSEKLPPRASGKKVDRVYDGDTVLLDDGHELRYIGIDAPETAKNGEPGDPLSNEATELNKKLVAGKELILEFGRERRDSHDRLLAYVYVAGAKEGERILVNAELIRNGLAWVYRHAPNNKYDDMLLKLQVEARKAKKGIWKLPPPAKKEKVYVSSHVSNRFHRPSCKYAEEINKNDREDYKTRDAAFDAGKSPCRECKP